MRRAALLVALLGVGCLPQVGPPVDGGGSGGGGGGGGPIDAGAACSDGVKNGDETDLDCGGACTPCAVGGACGTPLDCASGVCAAAKCAKAAVPCGAFSGCTGFVDATDAGAVAIIRFPVNGNRYSPDCVRVRFGQSVRFEGGNLTDHPIAQACGPVGGVLSSSGAATLEVKLDRALGVFGYYCTQHGSASGSGMAGAIEVVR